ncbi:MAG: hypothetical protein DIZ80_11785 [endosymbiont of Galathealinum brachiosum]|uniref:Uncharacterized protein n=1 Tax=endosymbiont of Galathealinum brachiosum TaxID=2200906 RepID=A0A370DDG4_9GAMM|nr:MAG: hypothetical protein DIZ80_11785 [endosymbiont of Galathealinum brachiosum]
MRIIIIAAALIAFFGYAYSQFDLSVLFHEKDNKANSPHLYINNTNNIYIKPNTCQLKTHRKIFFENIQICIEKEQYREIKNPNNNTLMFSRGDDGKQITLIPATDFQ